MPLRRCFETSREPRCERCGARCKARRGGISTDRLATRSNAVARATPPQPKGTAPLAAQGFVPPPRRPSPLGPAERGAGFVCAATLRRGFFKCAPAAVASRREPGRRALPCATIEAVAATRRFKTPSKRQEDCCAACFCLKLMGTWRRQMNPERRRTPIFLTFGQRKL